MRYAIAMTLAFVMMVGSGRASAQTTGEAPGQWQYEFTPYLWAAGISGDVAAGPLPTINADVSFADILKTLDFAAMGAFEARKDRWGALFDTMYIRLSTSGTASRTGPGPIGSTNTASANLEITQTMFASAIVYRVTDGRAPADVLGGLRYNKVNTAADIDATFFGSSGSVSLSGHKDWIDPYLGARVRYPLAERWTLVGYADVGGFGLGSDFTWQAALGVNYDFSKTVSGKLGYRELAIDYDNDGFIYDMKLRGLYVGVGIRF
jgi:opacity protein-like surface antigen